MNGNWEEKKFLLLDERNAKNVNLKIIFMFIILVIKNYEMNQMNIYMYYAELAICDSMKNIICEKVCWIKQWTIYIENDGENVKGTQCKNSTEKTKESNEKESKKTKRTFYFYCIYKNTMKGL